MNRRVLSKTNSGIYDGYQVQMQSVEICRFQALLARETVGRLLDIGCADGQFAADLQQSGWVCYGNDISATNVLLSRQRGVHAVVCDLSLPLPYADQSFGVVLAKQVCEHLIDTHRFFSECWRVLRSQGCLVVGTPNLASLANRIRLLLGRYPAYMDYELEHGQGHVRYYTRAILRQQLVSIGFQIEAQSGGVVPVPILSRILPGGTARPLIWLGSVFPSISDNLVIKARKCC
jgi:2-polyprenyl-3-methyl-5-hydroxy-6-metoxy-1,4-benzoquinol methylase